MNAFMTYELQVYLGSWLESVITARPHDIWYNTTESHTYYLIISKDIKRQNHEDENHDIENPLQRPGSHQEARRF